MVAFSYFSLLQQHAATAVTPFVLIVFGLSSDDILQFAIFCQHFEDKEM